MHNALGPKPQNGDASCPAMTGHQAGSSGDGAIGADDTTFPALAEAIAAAGGLLRLAEGIAAAGRPIDLSGLDNTLGRICAQALDLPPEQGARLRPAMAALVSDLDLLSQALRRR